MFPAALIVGGSLGNLLDRTVGGAVRDFIVGSGTVFNLADMTLLAGVLLAVLPPLATIWTCRARDHGPKVGVLISPR